MATYKLQWQSFTIGVPWQYDLEIASDAMAIDYAKRTAETDLGFRAGGMALHVWRMADEKLSANFVLNKPSARDTGER